MNLKELVPCRECGKHIPDFDVPYLVCRQCFNQPAPRERATKRHWCPICRYGIMPGERVKLNYGSGRWVHDYCWKPAFRIPEIHCPCRDCGRAIHYRGGRCAPCARKTEYSQN
jgi:hypothetical protein